MKFESTAIEGVHIIDLEPHEDERGGFARTFCRQEFAAAGLELTAEQASLSVTAARGTVRGMHFQREPWAETRLVRCTRGAILDVALDLRPESPTYLRHVSCRLDAANRRSLYIPPWCAHGFQTLGDDSEVSYLMSMPYRPESADGLRHDDPALDIVWPLPVTFVSGRDREWPLVP